MIHMKTKIKKAVVFLFGLLLLGCSPDFLDTKPIAVSSEETFYTTMASADMAVTTCYSIFNVEKVWDLSIMMTLGSISTDEAEAAAGGKGDVPEFQHVDQLNCTANEAHIWVWTWGYLFRAIGSCNIAIEKIPGITAETDPANYNADILARDMAQAKFIRAINFFTLCQIYGGVPKVDHILGPSEYKMKRSSIAEIYDLIKSDLHYAINVLPTKSQWGANNVGRASKGAAEALLAKVFLYESSYAKYYPNTDERFAGLEQHWDSAAYWAKQVITSDEYKLVGIDGEKFDTWRSPQTGGYQYIFMRDANNCDESVFDIQNRNDDLGWFISRGEGLTRWCMPRNVNASTAPVDSTVAGTGYGWGWWAPGDFLVNSYEKVGNVFDPRYKATVMESTDSLLIPDGSATKWVTPNFKVLYDATGVHRASRKYECSPAEYQTSEPWNEGPINVKLIRYADVVLFAAEASLEMGNQPDALTYINMVRTRARMSGPAGNTVPADLSAVTHDDIVHERLVEFGCEGHRFWDLVRWNLANTYLNHTLSDNTQVVYTPGKNEFWPIPAGEVTLSGGALEQNPEW
jgi:starch-binding outer membrane protein, SusD/RagB family